MTEAKNGREEKTQEALKPQKAAVSCAVPLEEAIASSCIHSHLTISSAESCTGGLVAGTLINAAGISAVYQEGYITYSNEAKEKLLGVSHDTLVCHGAVSWQTAKEMAEGCAKASGSDFSIVTTGIAGPGGGTLEKPVGLVYIGCFDGRTTQTFEKQYTGNRLEIRTQAVQDALQILYDRILARTGIDGGKT